MKTIRYALNQSWLSGMAALLIATSCGIKKIEEVSKPAPVQDSRSGSNNDGRDSDWPRYCSNALGFTSIATVEAALEQYFFYSAYDVPSYPGEVSGLEGMVGWCFRFNSAGADFRIEYEDVYGGGYYEMSALKSRDIASAQDRPIVLHLDLNSTANSLDVIFLDAQGLTQIVGSKSGDFYNTNLRYANLPSEVDYLEEFQKDVIEKCRSGEWTVAQCNGHSPPPKAWWLDTATTSDSRTLTMAREMLNGQHGAQAGLLGTMKFKLSDVLK